MSSWETTEPLTPAKATKVLRQISHWNPPGPASAATATAITAKWAQGNHAEPQVDRATCAGAAGTCLLPSPEERGAWADLPQNCPLRLQLALSTDSFWELARLEFLIFPLMKY